MQIDIPFELAKYADCLQRTEAAGWRPAESLRTDDAPKPKPRYVNELQDNIRLFEFADRDTAKIQK